MNASEIVTLARGRRLVRVRGAITVGLNEVVEFVRVSKPHGYAVVLTADGREIHLHPEDLEVLDRDAPPRDLLAEIGLPSVRLWRVSLEARPLFLVHACSEDDVRKRLPGGRVWVIDEIGGELVQTLDALERRAKKHGR